MASNQEESSYSGSVEDWQVRHEDDLWDDQRVPRRMTRNPQPSSPAVPTLKTEAVSVEPEFDDESLLGTSPSNTNSTSEEPQWLRNLMDHPGNHIEVIHQRRRTLQGAAKGLSNLRKIVEARREK